MNEGIVFLKTGSDSEEQTMSQYIGKTISLISNKGLRYVGLLDNINADDATVALKSVRSFGTEGRMARNGNPNLEVMPGNDVYDYVVFRGSDVKDLSVLDTPIEQVKPEPYVPAPTVPPVYGAYPQAPTATQTAPAAPAQKQAAPGQTPSFPAATMAPAGGNTVPAQSPHHTQAAPVGATPTTNGPTPTEPLAQLQPQAFPQPTFKSPDGALAGEKESAEKENKKDDKAPQTNRKGRNSIPLPEQDFDFVLANAKFSREVHEEEAETPKYDSKSSFFDNISSSTDEKNSMRWSEEKNLNLDTFGEASAARRGGRGRGRGRGNFRGSRGGRGRGRGNRGGNKKPEWA